MWHLSVAWVASVRVSVALPRGCSRHEKMWSGTRRAVDARGTLRLPSARTAIDADKLLEVALGISLGAQEQHVLTEVREAGPLDGIIHGANVDRQRRCALFCKLIRRQQYAHSIR